MSDNVKKALLMAMTATNDSGYNAVQQMVGYLATGDETYLPKVAREYINLYSVDEYLNALVEEFWANNKPVQE